MFWSRFLLLWILSRFVLNYFNSSFFGCFILYNLLTFKSFLLKIKQKGLYKPNGEIEGAEDEYYKAQKYLQDDQFYTDNYDALDEEDLDDFDIEELEEDDDEYDEDDDEEEKEEEDAPPKESLQKAFKKKLKISTDEPEKPMKTLREYMSEKEKWVIGYNQLRIYTTNEKLMNQI